MIAWVGNTEFWRKPPHSENPRFAMALCEEAVLETAFSPVYSNLRRLSQDAALTCTSRLRLRQRLALGAPDLNPDWKALRWGRVIKAPASCMGRGVTLPKDTEYIRNLRSYAPELAEWGVAEDFICGDQWEVDGFIIGGVIRFFRPLLQVWHEQVVIDYLPESPPDGITEAGTRALAALELDNTPFCVELRHSANGWKIIEVGARLGEDTDLPEKMSDRYPLDVIAEAVRESVAAEREPEISAV